MNSTQFAFVPLDIPKFNFDRELLLAFFESRKILPRYEFLKKVDDPWFAYEARQKLWPSTIGQIPGSGWDPDFQSRFPEIVSCVETLPFASIERVYFLEQHKEVKAHRDVSKEDDPSLGPSTFRCPIINDEPERTFYLSAMKYPDRCVFPQLPSETQWFGMNNHNCRHGSFLPSAGAKKLMLCVWGRVHREKWMELLNRSIKIHRNHSLIADAHSSLLLKPNEIENRLQPNPS